MEDGIGCALAGKLPRERLLALAEAVYKRPEGGTKRAHEAPARQTAKLNCPRPKDGMDWGGGAVPGSSRSWRGKNAPPRISGCP